jgi:beta-glucanase (GH16 family)
MTAYPRRSLGFLTAYTAAIGSLIVGCAHAQQHAESTAWELTFSDEFDGTAVDTDKWEVLNRKNSHNNELQYYLPEQASIVDGMLRLTATDEPFDGKAYRSARLESWFTQAYGRFEARAKLPTTKGIWPAIWLLPRTAKWPHGGEIDIMESRGSEPEKVTSAFHFANDAGEHEHVSHKYSAEDADGNPVMFPDDFHVYAAEWSPDEMVFFVDGVEVYRVNKDLVPVSSTPMCIILNNAVGGWFDGDPDETTVFPQHLDVDYVRVYQKPERIE